MDKYTETELDYIKNNYTTKTVKELASVLGRTDGSILYAARRLGIIKQKHNGWSEQEIVFLKEHYLEMTSMEIAKHINHTVSAINTKRKLLGLIRHPEWTDYEIQFLKLNYNTMSHSELGQELNKTRGAITAKCFDLGLYKQEPPWTESEIQFVKENYMEMHISDIAKKLNRTVSAVRLRADRMGMKKYPYTCNYHYFDDIDSEEKAYWLGFLTADGWISKNEQTNAGVVGIELQYNDINHLRKFNKSISGNYRITDRWKKCPLSSNSNKLNHTCCVRIFSLTMYNALLKYGFTNTKSFDAIIPNIDNNLIRHFIRGYFDGNGCISISNNRLHVDFCTAAIQLKDTLISKLKEIGISIKDYSYITEYGVTVYAPEATDTQSKLKLLNWMYKDSTIYLDRKYKKYLKVIQKYRTQESLTS